MADATPLTARTRLDVALTDDRFRSFCAAVANYGAPLLPHASRVTLAFPFGTVRVERDADRLTIVARAETVDRLARLQEIVATAGRNHVRDRSAEDVPVPIVWEGDLAGGRILPQFRLMRVGSVRNPAVHVTRIRLHGADLGRFRDLGGYHVRLLLPTPDNPDPEWPVRGADGLPAWTDPARRPVARVYTIRDLDVAAGWIDIDFVLHAASGPGADWARRAAPGDRIGVIGPLGRPIRPAHHYIFGADDTGLPALARILRDLPDTARGSAHVAVADPSGIADLPRPPAVSLHWLCAEAGRGALADAVCAAAWPPDEDCYGWFAADDESVGRVRARWRAPGGPGRDRCLTAVYWRRHDRAQTL